MGTWASVLIAIAAVEGAFVAVMGFRGLVEALQRSSSRCVTCGRTAVLPLPVASHRCWRCHYGVARHGVTGVALRHDRSG